MSSPASPRPHWTAEHPWVVRVVAASAVVILLGLAGRTVVDAFVQLGVVIIPTAVAVLLAGLLMPLMVVFNHRLHLSRGIAAGVTVAIAVGALTAVVALAMGELATSLNGIDKVVAEQVDALSRWLVENTPFGREQVADAVARARAWLADNQAGLAQGAVGAGMSAVGFVMSSIVALVALFFFLAQGDRLWVGMLSLLPRAWRTPLFEASRRGWVTLGAYCRTQLLVAVLDAFVLGGAALALGLPFVAPIFVLAFVACFIPVIGAIASGVVVIVIALAFKGVAAAVIMLLVAFALAQFEGNVLAPLLMGRAVNVHPLLVLVSVLAGHYLFGLVGALFSVPVIATLKSMVSYLAGDDPFPVLSRGGRALTDQPKRLMGERTEPVDPPLLGQVTPGWLEVAQEEAHSDEPTPEPEESEATEYLEEQRGPIVSRPAREG